MLADKERGLLLIGSANLTEQGLGGNAELVEAFDYQESRNEVALPLFQSALKFFEKLAADGVGQRLESNLETLKSDAPWLLKPLAGVRDPELPQMLSNLARPLLGQLVENLGFSVKEVVVLSPFFDAEPRLVKTLQQVTGSKALTIYTEHDALTKAWAREPAFTAGDLKLQLCGYKDDGLIQQLHGKAYAFSGENKVVLAMGSANFTSRGLVLSRDQGGNVEVMLRYPPAELARLPIPLLFDPEASARAVTSECDLADRAEEKIEPETIPFSLRLSEAAIREDSLELRIDGQELPSEMICQISQAKKPSWNLKLGNSEGGVLNAKPRQTNKTGSAALRRSLKSVPARRPGGMP